jgi:hypothetical protein
MSRPIVFQEQKNKSPGCLAGAFACLGSLALTYFRVRMHTIIGAASFHGPVRDGKVWCQGAIGTRHNLLSATGNADGRTNLKEVNGVAIAEHKLRANACFKVIGSSLTGN